MRLCNKAGVAVLCFTTGIHSFSVRSGITRGVIHENNIVKPSKKSFTPNKHCRNRHARLFSSISTPAESSEKYVTTDADESFDLTTALFCGGLAFDAYSEPSDSSRWEKGPQGTNVAFQSNAYTRSLYNGLLEVQPLRAVDLPNEDSAAESMMSGDGVDAYLLASIVEGKQKEDLEALKKQYNSGVLELSGSAHAGRSNTAWGNVREKAAMDNLKNGKSGSYHIEKTWTAGGQAVWEKDPPFYLYVQDPKDATIVFTVMDEDIAAEDYPIGSAFRKLTKLLPNLNNGDPMEAAKATVLQKLKNRQSDEPLDPKEIQKLVVQEWEGDIPLNIIPIKKDKGGQVATGVMVGAAVAGPVGAAVGALAGNLYEGMAKGKLKLRLRYLPIPAPKENRQRYEVKGGLPGVDWGEMYRRNILKKCEENPELSPDDIDIAGEDLELCVFVSHQKTGCSCAIYRSLEKKLIAISFRGTCAPVDLVTDASIVQTAWVDGEKAEDNVAKVHVGFRNSLNSIDRRVKELLLAAIPSGELLADYNLIITGHSLGGALATLFAMDVAEYGLDAGRGLPQKEPSEPWWSRVAGTFGKKNSMTNGSYEPPRPKEIKLYSFGSPRVGNDIFSEKFSGFVKSGALKHAYRVVNGEDVVARLPRTVNALGVVKIGYEHCGSTALISLPKLDGEETSSQSEFQNPLLWVEGESDDRDCPVRDGDQFISPLADGTLLGDLVNAVKAESNDGESKEESKINLSPSNLGSLASKFTGRLQQIDVRDIASIVGIDKKYVDREGKILSSIFTGEAIGHHMEDQYYLGMGRAAGFLAIVGEEIQDLN